MLILTYSNRGGCPKSPRGFSRSRKWITWRKRGLRERQTTWLPSRYGVRSKMFSRYHLCWIHWLILIYRRGLKIQMRDLNLINLCLTPRWGVFKDHKLPKCLEIKILSWSGLWIINLTNNKIWCKIIKCRKIGTSLGGLLSVVILLDEFLLLAKAQWVFQTSSPGIPIIRLAKWFDCLQTCSSITQEEAKHQPPKPNNTAFWNEETR